MSADPEDEPAAIPEDEQGHGRLTEGVVTFLNGDGQTHTVQIEHDYTLIRFIAEGRNSKQLHSTIICREASEIISVYTRFGYDADVPEAKRLAHFLFYLWWDCQRHLGHRIAGGQLQQQEDYQADKQKRWYRQK